MSMLKLKAVTFEKCPKLPGLRADTFTVLEFDKPHEGLRHWSVAVRGPALYFISPPGWRQGTAWDQWDAKGESTVVEVPRASCHLTWAADGIELDQIAKTTKYDSGPLGGPVPERRGARGEVVIDPKDLGDA